MKQILVSVDTLILNDGLQIHLHIDTFSWLVYLSANCAMKPDILDSIWLMDILQSPGLAI